MDIATTCVAGCAALFFGYNFTCGRNLMADRKKFGARVRKLYNFNTIYLPIVLVTVGTFLYLRNPHSYAVWGILLVAATAVCARIYATHIEPRFLRVRKVLIETPKVSAPLTILHVSDFETDEVDEHEPRMFSYIRRLQPDLLVHTGDLLNPQSPATYETEFPKLCALFKSVKPRHGKLNVLGEVDRPVLDPLRAGAGGMKTLFGESTRIDLPGSCAINVLGLTLEQSSNEDDVAGQINTWLANAPPNDFTLLIGHRPDFVLTAKDHQVDLCLAGHTHGGQVRFPIVGALFTMSNVPRKLARGFHRIGKTWINVSAGVGFEHEGGVPELRFNCPPEMTLITLKPI